ncbi:MAG: hypothetical protein GC201_01145 [Alphaproteobacteria bacterium]|nr:hypothetical protein [Alphaproteobacteria bacterium]
MHTIEDIIKACGGAARIAAAIGKSKDAIYKWPSIGIPDRHWSALIELSDEPLTPNDIFEANQAARAPAGEAGEAA